jgi:hypothetical protein
MREALHALTGWGTQDEAEVADSDHEAAPTVEG